MPVSKHRPDPNVIRNFKLRAGNDKQVEALDQSIEKAQKKKTTDLKARRQAKINAMVAGGLCKQVK